MLAPVQSSAVASWKWLSVLTEKSCFLRQAAGRSPHSRGARQRAETSSHSPARPPSPPSLPYPPRRPCRWPPPPRSTTPQRQPRVALSFGTGHFSIGPKLRGSSRQPEIRARPNPSVLCEVISGVIFPRVQFEVPNERIPLRTSNAVGASRSRCSYLTQTRVVDTKGSPSRPPRYFQQSGTKVVLTSSSFSHFQLCRQPGARTQDVGVRAECPSQLA